MSTAEQPQLDMPEPAAGDQPAGRMLAAARQAQNLSVTDVANRLKLSVQQVEALEQGAYDRLPGPVFVRGFTRNYARLLKLDPEMAVRAVDAHLPRADAGPRAADEETNIPMPARDGRRWPVFAGIAAAVFLGAALVDVLWPEVPSGTTAAPGVPAAPAGPQPPAAEPALARAPAAAEPLAVSNAPAASEPTAAVAAVQAAYQPGAGGGAALRLVFNQPSWVQIRDASGNVVLEALFPAGSSREITARPPLALVIGNAPGVRLTYGDRAVDLAPHTRVAVARLTLE